MQPSDYPDQWRHELKAEAPLLLHPYFDYPENHICFKPDGFAFPRDESQKGKETIEVCDLNRPELVRERLGQEEKVFHRLFRAMSISDTGNLFDANEPFFLWLTYSARFKLSGIDERLPIGVKMADEREERTG